MMSSSQALLQSSNKRQRRYYTQNDSQSTNHGVVSPLRGEIESQHDDDQSQRQHVLLPQLSALQVTIQRIERVVTCILESLDEGEPPVLNAREFSDENPASSKRFHNMSQCRNFTSILLVLSFCHSLLRSNRTTSTREVYYAFVTHFHHQKECDAAIAQAAALLHVPRLQLGLTASPKGWFCGSLEIVHPNGTVVDATSLSTVQGLPITREWLDRSNNKSAESRIQLRTSAECILVIEKEGIYTRLSEDRFFEHHVPCILVCGKGVPDLATRSLVHQLHMEFPYLPVYGLCDCNPYGLVVLQTYARGSTKLGVDGGLRYSVPIQWIGLMPSHVEELRDELPRDVLQALSGHDKKKLQRLLNSNSNPSFQQELQLMRQQDFKCEMEALHWNGMDFFSGWLEDLLWDYLDDEEEQESSMK